MASVRLILRTERTRSTGEAPIYVRLTHRRRSKYTALGVAVRPEHWQNDRQRVSPSHPHGQRLNALLAHKRAEYEELALGLDDSGPPTGKNGIRGLLAGAGGTSFLDYALDHVKRLDSRGRYSTARSYRTRLAQFADWLRDHRGKTDLLFMDFSLRLAQDFKAHLERDLGNRPNTVHNKFAMLRAILNQAQRDGLITEAQNISRRISTPGQKTARLIPTPGEMRLVGDLPLEPATRAHDTRNLYLFSSRMAGMRFSDAVRLRWRDLQGDHLQWRTRKTGRQIRLLVPGPVRVILDLYQPGDPRPSGFIFPFLRGHEGAGERELHLLTGRANTRCNSDLKEIARLAGLSRSYSFHTSRHYFATEALRRGVRVEVLREIMTHSTIEQTMAYVRISNKEMDEAMGGAI